jgi:hypothetical protein
LRRSRGMSKEFLRACNAPCRRTGDAGVCG